jgi:hypothetical protein
MYVERDRPAACASASSCARSSTPSEMLMIFVAERPAKMRRWPVLDLGARALFDAGHAAGLDAGLHGRGGADVEGHSGLPA